MKSAATSSAGLLLVASVFCAAPAHARIIIERVYQQADAYASANLRVGVLPGQPFHADSGGAPNRNGLFGLNSVAEIQNPATCCNQLALEDRAGAAPVAYQTGRIDGTSIVFSGWVTARAWQSPSRGNAGSDAEGLAFLRQFVQLVVEDTPETVTTTLGSVLYGRNANAFGQDAFASFDSGFAGNVGMQAFRDPATGDVVPGTSNRTLLPGRYELMNLAMAYASTGVGAFAGTHSVSLEFENTISFTNASFAAGATQDTPRMPDRITAPPIIDTPDAWDPTRPGAAFLAPQTGTWFDPEIASGYDFRTTGSLLFTTIMGLPVGFDGEFEVWVGDEFIGLFGAPDAVDFVARLGHGVTGFQIRGIVPGTDPDDPKAFPIQLAFSGNGDFVMTPIGITAVPEPSSMCMLAAGGTLLGIALRRKRRPDDTDGTA